MTHKEGITKDKPTDTSNKGDLIYTPLAIQSAQNNISNAEKLAILMVYFVQGALGLSRLAVTFFLKDNLHLNPAESAALMGITSLPWVIKPLYGFLSDGFPLFNYKRKSYLSLSGILGCISWLALASSVHDSTGVLVATTLGSAAVAVSDVVVDSIVVEKSQKQDLSEQYSDDNKSNKDKLAMAGDLQSLCWAASAFGGVLSAYFSGSLLQVMSPQSIFYITSLFPLLTTIASTLIEEQPVIKSTSQTSKLEELSTRIDTVIKTISQPSIYLPVLFVFLLQSTPSPDSAMFYFYTNELKFGPEFLGQIRLFASIASFAGVMLYRTKIKDLPIQQVLYWTTILSVPLGLSQLLLTTHYNRVLGIPDNIFVLSDSVVLTVLGQIAFMPILALAASLCPPGAEGTLFASLMSIYNLAGTLSGEIGAFITAQLGVSESNFDNLSLLLLICSLSTLLPLPFMKQMMKANPALDLPPSSSSP